MPLKKFLTQKIRGNVYRVKSISERIMKRPPYVLSLKMLIFPKFFPIEHHISKDSSCRLEAHPTFRITQWKSVLLGAEEISLEGLGCCTIGTNNFKEKPNQLVRLNNEEMVIPMGEGQREIEDKILVFQLQQALKIW